MWIVAKYILGEALASAAGGRWAARRASRKSLTSAPGPGTELGATPWDMLIAVVASTARTLRHIAIIFAVFGMTAVAAWVLYR